MVEYSVLSIIKKKHMVKNKNFDIGSLKIPVSGITKSFAILAKRGAGKSYIAGVMMEEMNRNGLPFVVFDPIDIFWGLRLSADGKGKGLPVVVFGLEHADIKLNRNMGREIAEAVVRENISCVISTFGMSKADMRHLIAEFSEILLNINDTPRHVFIEEAHEFVPQRVQSGQGVSFARVEALVTMGRNRGIGVSLINQRAATINKDVLTQIDTLIALRSVGPQDRKALKDWVEAHGQEDDDDRFNKFMTSLPSLPNGEAWIWSPEFMGIFEKIKIRKRETFHPDREKLGASFSIPKLNQADIQGFIDSFIKKPEPQKAKEKIGAVHDPVKLYTQEKLDKILQDVISQNNKKWQLKMKEAFKIINQYKEIISKATKILNPIHSIDTEPLTAEDIDSSQAVIHKAAEIFGVPVIRENQEVSNIGFDKCPRMIYSFLKDKGPRSFTKVQIGAATDYSVNSGGFKNAISRLISAGAIEKSGDGYRMKADMPELATFLNYNFSVSGWMNHMDKCPREIYNLLRDHSGRGFTKSAIAETTGYSMESGGFKNAISKLKSAELIIKEGDFYQVNQELLVL